MRTARSGHRGEGYFAAAPPRVLAHRGLAIEAPENTLLAFAKALAVGVDFVETDVHVSADGVAVVSHDPRLDRVAGREVSVDQLTAAELRRIDLGHGQGFPTLADALDAFPQARFNIDVKDAGAVLPAAEAIRAQNATNRVLITSFSEARRQAALRELPGVATSAAMGTAARMLAASKFRLGGQVTRILRSVDAVQLPERWKGVRVVTPRLIRLAHAAGVEVHVWTVNDPADMVRLLDLGVDGIVTDRADLAMAVLHSRA